MMSPLRPANVVVVGVVVVVVVVVVSNGGAPDEGDDGDEAAMGTKGFEPVSDEIVGEKDVEDEDFISSQEEA